MSRFWQFAVVAVVSSLAFAGVSRADSLDMNDGAKIEKALQTFSSNFDVRDIDDYANYRDQPEGSDAAQPRTDAGVQHIQASIKGNKDLVRRLGERGVKIDDVVNAEQAADGSMTFWVR